MNRWMNGWMDGWMDGWVGRGRDVGREGVCMSRERNGRRGMG